MSNAELVKKVDQHTLRLWRPSLSHIQKCLFDVFGRDATQWTQMSTSHRAPFREGRVIVNQLPAKPGRKSNEASPSMHSAAFSLTRNGGVLAVTASFDKPVIEGFEVHGVGLKGRTIYEDVAPSTGFVAVVGTDARTFGAAAFNHETGDVENLSEVAAFAVASHGLERAFRCSD